MPLLPTTKKYTRPQSHEQNSNAPLTLISVLEKEEYDLQYNLNQIEEAKSRERNLRLRLGVVQQSLQAFRALETPPEPIQEPIQEQSAQLPVTQERRVRKAATKISGKPTQKSIAPESVVSNTENINLVHDDFSTFPE